MPTIEEFEQLSNEGFSLIINPDGSIKSALAELQAKMEARLAEIRKTSAERGNKAFAQDLIQKMKGVERAEVNPQREIDWLGASVKFTMQAKVGEVCENAHGLKDGQLVIRQEFVEEIVRACIDADRQERTENQMFHEMCQTVSPYCGEAGHPEGTQSTLERIIKERNQAKENTIPMLEQRFDALEAQLSRYKEAVEKIGWISRQWAEEEISEENAYNEITVILRSLTKQEDEKMRQIVFPNHE